jgi:hypothetical protein
LKVASLAYQELRSSASVLTITFANVTSEVLAIISPVSYWANS